MELLGGQAVIEGVLIHHKGYTTVAVRKPNGKIIVTKEKIPWKNSKIPFIRGITNLFIMLAVGIQTLNYSSAVAMGEEKELQKEKHPTLTLTFTLLFSFLFAIAIFKLVPLGLTTLLNHYVTLNNILFNLIDGLIRVGLFVGYVYAISFFPDVKRLFQYHGAEHQAVACYEAQQKLTIDNVAHYSPLHKRCGTAFIFLVFLVSIFIFTLVPSTLSFWMKFSVRLLLLPVIAAISYELLRLGAHTKIFSIFVIPGLWIQKITTQKPDAQQIEVALRAVKRSLQIH